MAASNGWRVAPAGMLAGSMSNSANNGASIRCQASKAVGSTAGVWWQKKLTLYGRSLSAPMAVSRSEEHTSELQSRMRLSYPVFCLNKTIHIIAQIYNQFNTTHAKI